MSRLVTFPVRSPFNLINHNTYNSGEDKLFLVNSTNSTTPSNTVCLSNNKSSTNEISSSIGSPLLKKNNKRVQQEIEQSKFKSISEFNALLMSFVNSDKFVHASKLYSSLSSSDLNPNCWTYSIMVRCYCKNKEPQEAKRLLDQILDKGFQPNVVTFTVLVNEFCIAGRVKVALEVIETMGLINCKPTIQTYNCLLKGLCYVGKVEKAYELLINLKSKYSLEPDIYSYTAVMDGFCKVGRSNEALELLKNSGMVPNVASYNTLFTGYFKEGKPLEGIRLLTQMKNKNCMPDYISYSTLLHGLLKWGQTREAFGIYKEMVRIGFRVDERMTNTLLRGLCKKSRREKHLLNDAYEVFDRMKTWGICVYGFTFDLMIEAFCRGRKIDEALGSLERMVGFGYNPKETTFRNVIRALCDEGRIESALKVLFIYQGKGSLSRASLSIVTDKLNVQGVLISSSAVYGLSLKLGLIPCI